MGSDSGSRPIRATNAAPDQGEVTASRSQIEQWLRDTLPMMVDDAGFAYTHAASTIGTLRDALPSNATKLSQSWRGEASAEVQKALQKLHSTAEELVSTMEKMAEVLRLYGGVYLPEARQKIENLKSTDQLLQTFPKKLGALPPTLSATSGTSPLLPEVEDGTFAARQVLRTLNTQIAELYHRVPEEISYDLPTVTMPSGTHTYTPVVYREGDPYPNGRPSSGEGSQGAGTGSGGWGATGDASQGGSASASGSGASGSGASGSGASEPGGSNPGGSSPGGPGADGSDPGGSDPGGSDPGGSGKDDSGSAGSTGTNGQDPSTANEAGAAQNSPDDGTVPAVIDGTDGTSGGDDPQSTEVASFVPQNPAAVPVIQQSPVGLIGPTTTVAPPVTSVPPVLGTPGAVSGTAVPSYAATARGTMNGMPMMPFMGGGAGGESAQESERFSPLTEENDVWGSRPDATSALIGGSATDPGKARHGDRA
ncbi:WXG100 family type VII secretion target [Streptosporangium amethystogenes]|uniref:WXG100 family type VII secretion target n=1 Tax=Streptosporangium amethystogenes TaxID=2002 RepID=UPI0037A57C81